jgi:hypothetical protein
VSTASGSEYAVSCMRAQRTPARRSTATWRNVFLACAVIICMNFLMLLTYKDPGKEEWLERARLRKEGKLEQESLAKESLRELMKPHVWI